MDILDACVVHAARTAGLGVQGRFEDGAKDCRANVRPVEFCRGLLEEDETCIDVELRDDDVIREKPAIDVREGCELGAQIRVTLVGGIAGAVGRA